MFAALAGRSSLLKGVAAQEERSNHERVVSGKSGSGIQLANGAGPYTEMQFAPGAEGVVRIAGFKRWGYPRSIETKDSY